MNGADPEAGSNISRACAGYALVLLALINVLNYLDRNVIFALFEPIKTELALTDTQLGWLGSAYVIVYALAAVPLGCWTWIRWARTAATGEPPRAVALPRWVMPVMVTVAMAFTVLRNLSIPSLTWLDAV